MLIGPLKQRYAVAVKTSPTDIKDLTGVFEFCKIHPDFEPRLVSLHDQKIPGVETLAVADVLGLDRLSREYSLSGHKQSCRSAERRVSRGETGQAVSFTPGYAGALALY